ncbi:MAG TPA: YbaB/EbfC family nucleoid-associated protein [Actinoplanes sp.]|nr:YbaB/EbfC family nucleoid-associated protein [Actinoplanes sp.]
MAREIDEAWIDEAIDRYRRIEHLQAEFDRAVARTEVTVRSPDNSVEVVVTAAGAITDVRVLGGLRTRTATELGQQVRAAVAAAGDAAQWARRKLHDEVFTGYPSLGGR